MSQTTGSQGLKLKEVLEIIWSKPFILQMRNLAQRRWSPMYIYIYNRGQQYLSWLFFCFLSSLPDTPLSPFKHSTMFNLTNVDVQSWRTTRYQAQSRKDSQFLLLSFPKNQISFWKWQLYSPALNGERIIFMEWIKYNMSWLWKLKFLPRKFNSYDSGDLGPKLKHMLLRCR